MCHEKYFLSHKKYIFIGLQGHKNIAEEVFAVFAFRHEERSGIMNRTRALVLIGGFMLALAVLAALEFRKGEPVPAQGHMVTGIISKNGPAELSFSDKSNPSQVPKPVSVASAGVDTEMLRVLGNNATTTLPTIRKIDSNLQPGTDKIEKKEFVGNKKPEGADQAAAAETKRVVLKKQESLPSIKKPLETSKSAPSETISNPSQKVSADRKNDEKRDKTVAKFSVVTADEKGSQKTGKRDPVPSRKPGEANETEAEQPAAPLVMTTKAPDKLSGNQKAITRTRLELGKNIIFRLTGAAPLKAKTLLLPSPDRYVVDLQGEWGIVLPKVPRNLLLNGMRVGQRETATRLVFELKRKPQSAEVVTIDDTTLEVRIR